ncbi:hypothetical protein T01_8751 [Trichinella spiralis]|uniref:Uncharacterized protein n=1 Tax=Trichinella spiralis TaxID=6334 RepID=A0A0V1BKB5_TRISP|nr:hypothetical protein T01_8751 [Trichinella spiralis]
MHCSMKQEKEEGGGEKAHFQRHFKLINSSIEQLTKRQQKYTMISYLSLFSSVNVKKEKNLHGSVPLTRLIVNYFSI